MKAKEKHALKIRYLIRGDMPQVVDINEANGFYIDEAELITTLRMRNVAGIVAEVDDTVVGYLVYAFNARSLDICYLVVNPTLHCRGIGTALVDKIKSKMSDRRRAVYTSVSEYNVQSQVFLRSAGFVCVSTIANWDDSGDGYLFEFTKGD